MMRDEPEVYVENIANNAVISNPLLKINVC